MPTRFGIGPVTRETVRMLRRNWLALGLIVVALSVLSWLGKEAVGYVSGVGSIQDLSPGDLAATYGLDILFSTFLQGVVVALIWDDLETGRTSFGAALTRGLGKFIPLLALTIAIVVPFFIGLLLLIVPGVLLILRWSVANCVRVVEGPGLREALRRSAVLTKGKRGPILGIYSLYCVLLALVVPLSMRLASLVDLERSPALAELLTDLPSYALQCILATIFTVVYAELRREQEGGRPDDVAALFE